MPILIFRIFCTLVPRHSLLIMTLPLMSDRLMIFGYIFQDIFCNRLHLQPICGLIVDSSQLNYQRIDRLRYMDAIYQGHVQTVASNTYEVERAVVDADMVIGAVLVPGAKAPKLVTNELVSRMKPGSVLVDISIDQGGCFETSRETSHSDPTYIVDEVVHYAVGNIPGAVPRTSTYALTNATMPYLRELAARGVDEAIDHRPELAGGVNTRAGRIVNPVVADALEGG